MSHRLKKNSYDREKTIILNPSDGQRYVLHLILLYEVILNLTPLRRDHKTCDFELHEVYAVDVIVSTGDGKVCTHHTY